MKRIGIFGGSFDPVHNGHMSLVNDVINQVDLDMVYLVPARYQPFKLDKKATEGFHRLNMLKLASESFEKVEVSDFELERNDISYTVDTLEHFKREFPDAELNFITGTDSFIKIHTWMRASDFLGYVSVVVGARPGYLMEEIMNQKAYLESLYGTNVIIADNFKVDVSSTEIREKILKKESLEGLVDNKVERYIYENRLYE